MGSSAQADRPRKWAGTSGELLAKASADQEEILLAEVDLEALDRTRTHWPFLRDRRIDAYHDINRRLSDGPT